MADEARAMLDALMGGDRNAPIPQGAALKRRSNNNSSSSSSASGRYSKPVIPGRRKRSCYDTDVCPLYCAWGVDIYDLFVNTKSDLGRNRYVVDEEAREEYLSLPDHERDRLGYDRMLFEKLSDLVRSCDRIVRRNQEKLRDELARQQRARGQGQVTGAVDDLVHAIPDEQLTRCAEDVAKLDLLEDQIEVIIVELEKIDKDQEGMRKTLMEKVQADSSNGSEEVKPKEISTADKKDTKPTDDKDTDKESKNLADELKQNDDAKKDTNEKDVNDKPKETDGEDAKKEESAKKEEDEKKNPTLLTAAQKEQWQELERRKAKLLAEVQFKVQQTIPLRDSVESLRRSLTHVRSDTTSDKTVCEVSGNFMSSRDADERIAAHYAGKQYVGWKMVREKLKQLQRKYGRGGPPSGGPGPHRGGGGGGNYGGPPPGFGQGYGQGGNFGGGNGGGGGGGRHHHPPGGGHGYPPPGYRDYPPPHRGHESHRGGGGGPPHGDSSRRERSRSRDRDARSGSSRRSGGGGSSSRSGRKSPSPSRWERDRGGSRGYDGRRRDRDRRRR